MPDPSDQHESQPRTWTDDLESYRATARLCSPVVDLVSKDHWVWRWIAWGLWLCSAGRLSRQRFLRDFATTLGPLQAYPAHWPRISRALIIHESRHTVQCERLGWLVPLVGWLGRAPRAWSGLLPMGLVYLLLPLPIFFAWGRMRLELDAENASWRIGLREGWHTPERVRQQAIAFADLVSGPEYLWSWPRTWTRRCFSRRAERTIAECSRLIQGTPPIGTTPRGE
ncbi:MAG: hypothetical protein KDB14_22505 [Planctomycetales bacterium]|nr:hypothetical protein [Planctomycetales bacterium]